MPDQPSSRRRFQFRLRSLLIAVAMLALPLGYVGWKAKIVRDRPARACPAISTGTSFPRWSGDTNLMPVIADLRVIPQSLDELLDVLRDEG